MNTTTFNITQAGARRLRALGAVFSLLALATGLLFANNVLFVVKWWRAFYQSGRDATVLAQQSIYGFAPALNWSAIDTSCVTTFIPFIGFYLAARALFRASRGRPSGSPGCFPYFAAFDSLNIALGLIGTLWGVILIGYYQMDTIGMGDLMMCLHTALFSTLTAVIWVYLIDRPILRPWLMRVLQAAQAPKKPEEEEDEDILEVFERLESGASKLCKSWDSATKDSEALRESLQKTAGSLSAFSEAGAAAAQTVSAQLDSAFTRLQSQIKAEAAAAEARNAQWREAVDAQVKQLSESVLSVSNAMGQVASAAAATAQLQEAFASVAEKLRLERDSLAEQNASLQNDCASLKGRVSELTSNLQASKAQVTDLSDRLRSEITSFEKRLNDLRDKLDATNAAKAKSDARATQAEARAEASQAEANQVKKLLARVRAAFGGEH